MRKLIFATGNENKAKEIKFQTGAQFQILTLKDVNFNKEIPEPFETIEENAVHKAKVVFETFNENCFAEDTGLIVPALNGEPGVYSARYAGPQKNAEDNMNLLLKKLEQLTDRSAYFKTVIALFLDEKLYQFEGIAKGKIISEKLGTKGFGYDPIFKPEGYDKTFAQIDLEEKSKISHRAKATAKLIQFLKNRR